MMGPVSTSREHDESSRSDESMPWPSAPGPGGPPREHPLTGEPAVPAVEWLREQLRLVRLPLETERAADGRRLVRQVLDQIDDYVLPRVRHLDAPLLAVVGGSTGAGKSTVVNALVGRPVTRAGVVRPTTREPVLIHHPDDASAFEGARVLPHLARIRARLGRPQEQAGADAAAAVRARSGGDRAEPTGTSLVLLGDDGVPSGIAVLDAPDIDSVSEANRQLAGQLLAAADLWLFTTTANRYADAAAWDLLIEAGRRSIAVAVILDRVPPGALAEIEPDLRRMLREHALEHAPIFVIPESPLNASGMLPVAVVDPLRSWLRELAADAQARSQIARRTLGGALRQVGDRADEVAEALRVQAEAHRRLTVHVDQEYGRALREIDAATRDGSLLRDEVLSRWQDFVGTGDFFRSVEARIGRWRDRAGAALRGKPAPEVQVEQELESGLRAVILEELARAGEQTQRSWRVESAGRGLLGDQDLGRLPEDAAQRCAAVIRAWQGEVMAMIQREGAGKRTQARLLSIGLNVVTVGLMVVVFSMSAGLTGAEIGIAGASGVVGTRLLEAVFGEDAVRRMAEAARRDLETRTAVLVRELRGPWDERLDAVQDPPPERLQACSDAVRTAGDGL